MNPCTSGGSGALGKLSTRRGLLGLSDDMAHTGAFVTAQPERGTSRRKTAALTRCGNVTGSASRWQRRCQNCYELLSNSHVSKPRELRENADPSLRSCSQSDVRGV